MISASRAGTALVSLAAIATCAVPAMGGAKVSKWPTHYEFAGVPWLVSADTAVARLVARGYVRMPDPGVPDRVVCRGRLWDHAATVTAHLDERRRLVRWTVMIMPASEDFPYPAMHEVYDQAMQQATEKYGPPPVAVHHFDFPYKVDDGRQDRALREGKAEIRCEWISRRADRLTIAMDASSSVVMSYESPEWAALEARRQRKKAADL